MPDIDLTNLEAAVARDKTVNESAITLLNGLSQALKDAKDDPAAIQAIIDQLDSQQQALADAVAANTPAAPGGGGN